MTKPDKKLDGLEALRGVAALTVLLHHAFGSIALPQNYNMSFFGGLYERGILGVSIFFVLSGFVIACSNQRDGLSGREILIYALRRISRIFPMYWVALVTIVPLYVAVAADALGPLSVSRTFQDLFLLPGDQPPMLPGAWTLVYEMIFYLLFIPMLVNRRVAAALWSALAIAVIAFYVTDSAPRHPWTEHLFSLFVLQFIGGMTAFHAATRFPVTPRKARTFIATGALLIVATAVFEQFTGILFGPANIHHAAWTVMIVFGIACLPEPDPAKKGLLMRTLQTLGRYSYSIYLFHIPIQKIVVKSAIKVTGPAPGPAVVCLVSLLVIAVSLFAGILAGKFIELPLLEWTKRQIAKLKRSRPAPPAQTAIPTA